MFQPLYPISEGNVNSPGGASPSQLAQLRGLEQLMWDAYDRPEWLADLVSWMSGRILEHIDQTEAANGFRLCNHQNQAMPYCRELQPPSASDRPVSTKQLWGYMAAQEFTTFGPEMFDAFLFRFQQPILERYGLAAYGCCEDLTQKIPIIRRLKNLRRIAVSPFADPKKCAEQIGGDYVLSWRPNPSSACSYRVDEDFTRRELRQVMGQLRRQRMRMGRYPERPRDHGRRPDCHCPLDRRRPR